MHGFRAGAVVLAVLMFASAALCKNTIDGYSGKSVVELKISYDFSVSPGTSRIKFIAVIPKSIRRRQTILSIIYSKQPLRTFSENGNLYAEFLFTKPQKRFELEINIQVQPLRYDLTSARRLKQKDLIKGFGFEDFLKHEKYLEKDYPEIQRIAKSITGRNEVEIVNAIYEYITDNMTYGKYNKHDLGILQFLKLKTGDCSEYSDLFVALCRAKGIAAKVMTGYTTKFDNTPRHAWVEVYLESFGWVPFDPTMGDVKNPVQRSKNFSTLYPNYIASSHIRNDPVINNGHYCAWLYWDGKIKVEDSVKIRRLGRQRETVAKAVESSKLGKKDTGKSKSSASIFGVVQSISHSDTHCSVVINNQILHEQDTIVGVKIIKIYPDKVEFEKNSKRWTQGVTVPADKAWRD